MKAYGTLLGVIDEYNVDGITFEKDDGTVISFDFGEQDYFKRSKYTTDFRLKSACVWLEDDWTDLDADSDEVYELIRDANLTEIVVYPHSGNLTKRAKLKSLTLLIGNHKFNANTRRCSVY